MSRIGKQPVIIPDNVTVTLTGGQVVVKAGALELKQSIPVGVTVKINSGAVQVSPNNDSRPVKALHGLVRSLIANMVIGVTAGYTKTLEIQGTGYRATPKGEALEFSLGYSHPILFNPPQGIKLALQENKYIVITGADKYLVGQVAANIRDLRQPDPYKGKGIRYKGEVIKLKPGKAAKAAAA